ncbi:hypothetical protein PCE1_004572 [Barthelona sp. PCE]
MQVFNRKLFIDVCEQISTCKLVETQHSLFTTMTDAFKDTNFMLDEGIIEAIENAANSVVDPDVLAEFLKTFLLIFESSVEEKQDIVPTFEFDTYPSHEFVFEKYRNARIPDNVLIEFGLCNVAPFPTSLNMSQSLWTGIAIRAFNTRHVFCCCYALKLLLFTGVDYSILEENVLFMNRLLEFFENGMADFLVPFILDFFLVLFKSNVKKDIFINIFVFNKGFDALLRCYKSDNRLMGSNFVLQNFEILHIVITHKNMRDIFIMSDFFSVLVEDASIFQKLQCRMNEDEVIKITQNLTLYLRCLNEVYNTEEVFCSLLRICSTCTRCFSEVKFYELYAEMVKYISCFSSTYLQVKIDSEVFLGCFSVILHFQVFLLRSHIGSYDSFICNLLKMMKLAFDIADSDTQLQLINLILQSLVYWAQDNKRSAMLDSRHEDLVFLFVELLLHCDFQTFMTDRMSEALLHCICVCVALNNFHILIGCLLLGIEIARKLPNALKQKFAFFFSPSFTVSRMAKPLFVFLKREMLECYVVTNEETKDCEVFFVEFINTEFFHPLIKDRFTLLYNKHFGKESWLEDVNNRSIVDVLDEFKVMSRSFKFITEQNSRLSMDYDQLNRTYNTLSTDHTDLLDLMADLYYENEELKQSQFARVMDVEDSFIN